MSEKPKKVHKNGQVRRTKKGAGSKSGTAKKAAAKGKQIKQNGRKNYIGLSKLILLNVIPILTVVILVIFSIVFVNVQKYVTEQINQRLHGSTESVCRKIEVWSTQCLSALELIANQYETGYLGDKDNYTAYMEEWAETIMPGSEGIYIVYDDGKGTTLSHDGKEEWPEFVGADWFEFGLTCDTPQFDKCSYFETDTDYTVTCAKNLKDRSGKVIGIAASDLHFDTIRDTVTEESKDLDSSFLMIDNKSGMVIAASNKDYCGKTKADAKDQFLIDLLDKFNTNVQNATVNTSMGKYVINVHGITGTDWYLMIYEDYGRAYATLNIVFVAFLIGTVVCILCLSALITFTVNRLMKNLKKSSEGIIKISNGNLRVKFEATKGGLENEITDINNNLHFYMSKLTSIISDVETTSGILQDDAIEFDNMAGDLNDATIAEKMSLDNLSDDIESISDSIQSLSEDSKNLSMIAEDASECSKEAKTHMEAVRADSEATAVNLNKVAESMHIAQGSINELVSHVTNVENSAEQISSITSVIKDIASQTNLLSLNASIEAARAGEVGKGFAVVAEEIKQLADTSNENAEMIENLINNISELMSKTGDATRRSAEDITKGVEVLESIVDSYGDTVNQVKATSEQIDRMLENSKEVDEISGRMAEVAEVQSTGTKTILMSANDLGQMVDNAETQSSKLKDGAENLKEIAEKLHRQMGFFKL
ncbi:methyl-accepting chemotaxis sensory transducer with Cache sensor [Lachnospiraceae bacterium]|nr:methyl-accepting chemotaxis sensory transducer with Cache sensor [Lachnospiraceae bacterium]